MGKKTKAPRVVLDTNVLVSALLFRGEMSRFVSLWKSGAILPAVSKDTFDELLCVLNYPKFKLTPFEIKAIVQEEILPYFEVVEVEDEVHGICSDPDDDMFISCALANKSDYIISGDKALCDVRKFKSVKIITAAEFLLRYS